jgi:hypothetical protein
VHIDDEEERKHTGRSLRLLLQMFPLLPQEKKKQNEIAEGSS